MLIKASKPSVGVTSRPYNEDGLVGAAFGVGGNRMDALSLPDSDEGVCVSCDAIVGRDVAGGMDGGGGGTSLVSRVSGRIHCRCGTRLR